MSDPMPVIVCGALPAVINAAKVAYLPEYEVIHAIFSSTLGATEIPLILQGKIPPPGEKPNLGTQNYARPARAVFAGAAYDDEAWEKMRAACKGISKVPWLRPDMSKPRPPVGPGYAEAMVARVKACMKGVIEEGRLDEDGVYWF